MSGLDLLVRALTDLGEWDLAKTALAELSSIATLVGTIPLRAAASFAAGYLALGLAKPDTARLHLEDAVDLFVRSGAPFEVARARIQLARALGELGRVQAATEEAQRAIDLLSELKAELEMARARNVLELLVNRWKPEQPRAMPRRGGITKREIEVLRLVAEGLNNQTIAERLFVSDHTFIAILRTS
jgi:ATP/maltotriose-dependent transcriptional regulator MalT